MLPSRDLVRTTLVLTAEAVAVLIADDANNGNNGCIDVSHYVCTVQYILVYNWS